MTVRCLTSVQKTVIAQFFSNHAYTVDALARQYHCSARTIHRVLEEQGVAPVRRKRTMKPKPILVQELPTLTVIENIKCLFKAVFFKSKKPDEQNKHQ